MKANNRNWVFVGFYSIRNDLDYIANFAAAAAV